MLCIAFFYCLNPKADEHRISINGIEACFKSGIGDILLKQFTYYLLIFVNYILYEYIIHSFKLTITILFSFLKISTI